MSSLKNRSKKLGFESLKQRFEKLLAKQDS